MSFVLKNKLGWPKVEQSISRRIAQAQMWSCQRARECSETKDTMRLDALLLPFSG